MKTKFFHFLLTLKKNTQHATRNAYQLLPLENFDIEFDDNTLYKKYNLTEDEIRIIETTIGEI
jgi:site-specific DNA-methyltransferase (adenine-specific)